MLTESKWSLSYWVEQAKASRPEYVGCFVPVVQCRYTEFAEAVGTTLSLKDYRHSLYPEDEDALFGRCGLTLIGTAYHNFEAIDLLTSVDNGQPSIHQQYLDGLRNVFIVEITDPITYTDYVFVLEYTDFNDPLKDHVVDPEELAEHLALKESAKAFMARVRTNRSDADPTDLPF